MRPIVLVAAFVGIVGIASSASAQNVGVTPGTKSGSGLSSIFNFFVPHNDAPAATDPKPAAPTPTPAPAPQAALPVTTPPRALPQSPAPPSSAALSQAFYLPPEQQQQFIELEQNTIKSLQQSMTQTNQLSATMSTVARTQAEKNQVPLMDQQTYADISSKIQTQTMNDINAQMEAAQQRLRILQAGPMKLSDFANLYH